MMDTGCTKVQDCQFRAPAAKFHAVQELKKFILKTLNDFFRSKKPALLTPLTHTLTV
jgi:hypothetical protein